MLDVINETVGDAISDMLLVEAVLYARGWSVSDWNDAYTDLPNRQMKVMNDLKVLQNMCSYYVLLMWIMNKFFFIGNCLVSSGSVGA